MRSDCRLIVKQMRTLWLYGELGDDAPHDDSGALPVFTASSDIQTAYSIANSVIRIWALSGGNKAMFYFAALVLLGQWLIVLYATGLSPKGTSQIAVLLPLPGPPPPPGTPLPVLPEADPYHSKQYNSLYAGLTFSS
jgi:hypothetical protein